MYYDIISAFMTVAVVDLLEIITVKDHERTLCIRIPVNILVYLVKPGMPVQNSCEQILLLKP